MLILLCLFVMINLMRSALFSPLCYNLELSILIRRLRLDKNSDHLRCLDFETASKI